VRNRLSKTIPVPVTFRKTSGKPAPVARMLPKPAKAEVQVARPGSAVPVATLAAAAPQALAEAQALVVAVGKIQAVTSFGLARFAPPLAAMPR
jgi:hypothetical protein